MASWIAGGFVRVGRNSTVACSVARLTVARATPSKPLKPCSIRATQDAQDIPWIGTVTVWGFGGGETRADFPLDSAAGDSGRRLGFRLTS